MNDLDIEVYSYWRILVDEALNPFYAFQLFSVTVWMLDSYYIFAGCVVLISVFSLTLQVVELRKQRVNLKRMITTEQLNIPVVNASFRVVKSTSSRDLVPGDVIFFDPHHHYFIMPCDAILIGGNVVVDEGILTGESIPVTKLPIPSTSSSSSPPPSSPQSSSSSSSSSYSSSSCHKHILFCGTKILQIRSQVRAIVLRTGFSTAKGQLVRSIMYPKPIGESFYSDAFKFVIFLILLALVGMIYAFCILSLYQVSDKIFDRIITSLDIITIAVPPALPAALTVGLLYAQSRLKNKGIFCTNPRSINLSANVDCCCFDKTGTLTEEGLNFWGVVEVDDDATKTFKEPIRELENVPSDHSLVVAMASCHNLNVIGGEVNGDPLDVKMFEAVNWIIEDETSTEHAGSLIVRPQNSEVCPIFQFELAKNYSRNVVLLRQFPFESSLQRMGVIVKIRSTNEIVAFVKGAPETMKSFCKTDSLPTDFEETLRDYTSRGLRVIAISSKKLEASLNCSDVKRLFWSLNEIETALNFMGFLIFENKLKEQTEAILKELRQVNIRTIMITGDNMETAICVARQCGMLMTGWKVIRVEATTSSSSSSIDDENRKCMKKDDDGEDQGCACYHFVIDGKSFDVIVNHFRYLLPKIMTKATIFARMSPEQKAYIIECLKNIGYTVCMCGDGANDCTALKSAHIGVSLSQFEASVAATFTYNDMDVSCVPAIIKEGKGSLVTSFGMFNFMALYSIIQYSSFIILLAWMKKLEDGMFLFIDLFLVTSLTFTMGRTHPSDHLTKRRPPSRLASPGNIIGLLSHVLIQVGFQLAGIMFLKNQSWYKSDMDKTCIFYITLFQYTNIALTFSLGYEFKKPFWTNAWFMVVLVASVVSSVVFVFDPLKISYYLFNTNWIGDVFFRILLLNFVVLNGICTQLLQMLIRSQWCIRTCDSSPCRPGPQPLHQIISRQLNKDYTWPPYEQKMKHS
ncbi:hypothetical protein HELRODRAFT_112766 [Helobdella robusta]|uniref:P-type ATPase A domain-containing protein n=1 Tax=Helobdella robusta TaxID=6412 RepID=T1EFM0_HELRO|nr:hypothetical protein HELRODRAFT_112766 [Helobdella robusta]ESO01370.1 hypothetical protein HELRODRAFT_112766 [Helobdella robusta]